jgi:hypothetical protein
MKQHTHPLSASDRTRASAFCEHVLSTAGYDFAYRQMSKSDQRRGRKGDRSWHWAKDVIASPSTCESNADIYIDVDYHIDMPKILSTSAKPTMLYTLTPSDVSYTGEYSFTFLGDGRVKYMVAGGATYMHHLWNYNHDSLSCVEHFFGVPIAHTVYQVEKRSVDPHHSLVLLNPIGRWNFPFSLLSHASLQGDSLERLNIVQGEFTRLYVKTDTELMISTGRINSYASSTIPANIDDSIAATSRTSKQDLAWTQVMAYTGLEKSKAAALVEFHRQHLSYNVPTHFVTEDRVIRYQPFNRNFDPDSKTAIKAYMDPIIPGAYSPDMNKNNENYSVQKRIVEVAHSRVITPFMIQCRREFLERLIPTPHRIIDVDFDEVWKKQNRPNQRNQLLLAGTTIVKRITKMFLKREAYQSPKAPRAISTINETDKERYSRMIYSASEYVKQFDWYAFAKNPKQVAQRVADICEKAENLANTDFSKMDGRICEPARELELAFMLRLFHPLLHEEIKEQVDKHMNLKGISTHGVVYDTLLARLSGAAPTSLFNTLDNVFTAFLHFRMRGMSPSQAYSKLGIYGGDDGITADVEPDTYVRAADLMGQSLTIDVIERGCSGVTFLSRQYSPDVWFGDLNSCSDLYRALSKFHTSVNLPENVSNEEKLLEKSRAYYLTDSESPILGTFVSRVVELAGGEIQRSSKTRTIERWGSDIPKENQYPNEEADWMWDYAQNTILDDGFAIDRFNAWLNNCETVTQLLTNPQFMEIKPIEVDIPMVVGEDVAEPSKRRRRLRKRKRKPTTGEA